MDYQFENRYYEDPEVLEEFVRKYRTGPGPLRKIFLAAMMLLGVVFLLIPSIELGSKIRWVFILACLTLIWFLPKFCASTMIRNEKKQNDGILPETVITFGDTIEMQQGCVHITVEYRKLIKVERLKHSYILQNGKRSGVIIQPDRFTKGTFAEFREFLQAKRPDLKIPD